jgi:7-cyano-7-deazaguanine synthase in queuosine biosynthesis
MNLDMCYLHVHISHYGYLQLQQCRDLLCIINNKLFKQFYNLELLSRKEIPLNNFIILDFSRSMTIQTIARYVTSIINNESPIQYKDCNSHHIEARGKKNIESDFFFKCDWRK